MTVENCCNSARLISDNGKQFTGKEFANMIATYGLSHSTTAVYYPQSNGKIERWHQTFKIVIRPKHLNSLEHAQEIVDAIVKHYNEVRLHSAIGYITPKDMLEGRQAAIHAERDRKLAAARQARGYVRAPKKLAKQAQDSQESPSQAALS